MYCQALHDGASAQRGHPQEHVGGRQGSGWAHRTEGGELHPKGWEALAASFRELPKLNRCRGALPRERGVSRLTRARVSQGYLVALEGGLKNNPSLATLIRLARALDVPVTRLLE